MDLYGLAYRSNKWYIAAYCHRRQAVRTFRVDRMQQLVETGRTFHVPPDFSVKTYFEQVTAVQETSGDEACFVLIEGTADSLKRLSGHWYLRNCVVKRDGQTLGLSIDEEVMMKYLPALLLSYTSTVRVLEPQSLKLEIGKIVRELYGFYATE
ncbi:helix-turn-helix transcriptional regulator [Paenibacillus alkaliterrae]|uniref:helix-turn-helix transcriptional regulator n=1 Tax=Paenibacillus alkaliterrae TaxID=320909 RepID=UPI002286AB53|nr:WYL domain-containing protein [Paenibacillus alkaliterrae]